MGARLQDLYTMQVVAVTVEAVAQIKVNDQAGLEVISFTIKEVREKSRQPRPSVTRP